MLSQSCSTRDNGVQMVSLKRVLGRRKKGGGGELSRALRCTYIASPLVRLSTAFIRFRARFWQKGDGHRSLTIPVKVPIVKEVCPGILLN